MADNAAALAAVAVGLLFLVLGGLVWVISRATGEGDAAGSADGKAGAARM